MSVIPDPVTFSDVQGNFKNVYAPQIVSQVPEWDLLQSKALGLDWRAQERNAVGAAYQVPLVLQDPQGWTWLGESGDVQNLQQALPMIVKQASVQGSEENLRIQLSNKSVLASTPAGLRAFTATATLAMKRMNAVMRNRNEMAALYGQSANGYGIIETITNVSGETYNIVISLASWAPGYWQQAIGGYFECFASGTIVGTSLYFKLNGVTQDTRTLNVTFTGTGSGSVAPANTIMEKTAQLTASTFNQFVGLETQFSAETGTFFGLDRSTYANLKGNPYDAAGDAISKELLVDAFMSAVNRGNMGSCVCLVGSSSWATLWSADTALRRQDSSYSKDTSASGSKRLMFTGVNGDITVFLHPFVKQGEAFMFSPDSVYWTGAATPTFNIPGSVPGTEAQAFFVNQDQNSIEARLSADLAIFTDAPGKGVFISGLVN